MHMPDTPGREVEVFLSAWTSARGLEPWAWQALPQRGMVTTCVPSGSRRHSQSGYDEDVLEEYPKTTTGLLLKVAGYHPHNVSNPQHEELLSVLRKSGAKELTYTSEYHPVEGFQVINLELKADCLGTSCLEPFVHCLLRSTVRGDNQSAAVEAGPVDPQVLFLTGPAVIEYLAKLSLQAAQAVALKVGEWQLLKHADSGKHAGKLCCAQHASPTPLAAANGDRTKQAGGGLEGEVQAPNQDPPDDAPKAALPPKLTRLQKGLVSVNLRHTFASSSKSAAAAAAAVDDSVLTSTGQPLAKAAGTGTSLLAAAPKDAPSAGGTAANAKAYGLGLAATAGAGQGRARRAAAIAATDRIRQGAEMLSALGRPISSGDEGGPSKRTRLHASPAAAGDADAAHGGGGGGGGVPGIRGARQRVAVPAGSGRQALRQRKLPVGNASGKEKGKRGRQQEQQGQRQAAGVDDALCIFISDTEEADGAAAAGAWHAQGQADYHHEADTHRGASTSSQGALHWDKGDDGDEYHSANGSHGQMQVSLLPEDERMDLGRLFGGDIGDADNGSDGSVSSGSGNGSLADGTAGGMGGRPLDSGNGNGNDVGDGLGTGEDNGNDGGGSADRGDGCDNAGAAAGGRGCMPAWGGQHISHDQAAIAQERALQHAAQPQRITRARAQQQQQALADHRMGDSALGHGNGNAPDNEEAPGLYSARPIPPPFAAGPAPALGPAEADPVVAAVAAPLPAPPVPRGPKLTSPALGSMAEAANAAAQALQAVPAQAADAHDPPPAPRYPLRNRDSRLSQRQCDREGEQAPEAAAAAAAERALEYSDAGLPQMHGLPRMHGGKVTKRQATRKAQRVGHEPPMYVDLVDSGSVSEQEEEGLAAQEGEGPEGKEALLASALGRKRDGPHVRGGTQYAPACRPLARKQARGARSQREAPAAYPHGDVLNDAAAAVEAAAVADEELQAQAAFHAATIVHTHVDGHADVADRDAGSAHGRLAKRQAAAMIHTLIQGAASSGGSEDEEAAGLGADVADCDQSVQQAREGRTQLLAAADASEACPAVAAAAAAADETPSPAEAVPAVPAPVAGAMAGSVSMPGVMGAWKATTLHAQTRAQAVADGSHTPQAASLPDKQVHCMDSPMLDSVQPKHATGGKHMERVLRGQVLQPGILPAQHPTNARTIAQGVQSVPHRLHNAYVQHAEKHSAHPALVQHAGAGSSSVLSRAHRWQAADASCASALNAMALLLGMRTGPPGHNPGGDPPSLAGTEEGVGRVLPQRVASAPAAAAASAAGTRSATSVLRAAAAAAAAEMQAREVALKSTDNLRCSLHDLHGQRWVIQSQADIGHAEQGLLRLGESLHFQLHGLGMQFHCHAGSSSSLRTCGMLESHLPGTSTLACTPALGSTALTATTSSLASASMPSSTAASLAAAAPLAVAAWLVGAGARGLGALPPSVQEAWRHAAEGKQRVRADIQEACAPFRRDLDAARHELAQAKEEESILNAQIETIRLQLSQEEQQFQQQQQQQAMVLRATPHSRALRQEHVASAQAGGVGGLDRGVHGQHADGDAGQHADGGEDEENDILECIQKLQEVRQVFGRHLARYSASLQHVKQLPALLPQQQIETMEEDDHAAGPSGHELGVSHGLSPGQVRMSAAGAGVGPGATAGTVAGARAEAGSRPSAGEVIVETGVEADGIHDMSVDMHRDAAAETAEGCKGAPHKHSPPGKAASMQAGARKVLADGSKGRQGRQEGTAANCAGTSAVALPRQVLAQVLPAPSPSACPAPHVQDRRDRDRLAAPSRAKPSSFPNAAAPLANTAAFHAAAFASANGALAADPTAASIKSRVLPMAAPPQPISPGVIANQVDPRAAVLGQLALGASTHPAAAAACSAVPALTLALTLPAAEGMQLGCAHGVASASASGLGVGAADAAGVMRMQPGGMQPYAAAGEVREPRPRRRRVSGGAAASAARAVGNGASPQEGLGDGGNGASSGGIKGGGNVIDCSSQDSVLPAPVPATHSNAAGADGHARSTDAQVIVPQTVHDESMTDEAVPRQASAPQHQRPASGRESALPQPRVSGCISHGFKRQALVLPADPITDATAEGTFSTNQVQTPKQAAGVKQTAEQRDGAATGAADAAAPHAVPAAAATGADESPAAKHSHRIAAKVPRAAAAAAAAASPASPVLQPVQTGTAPARRGSGMHGRGAGGGHTSRGAGRTVLQRYDGLTGSLGSLSNDLSGS